MVAPPLEPSPDAAERGRWAAPVAIFGVIELIAAVGIPYIARRAWFFGDEWDFLSTRTAWNLRDLFRPHNEHWSTLPLLAYRGMWQLFGLRYHTPYLMLDVLLHLALAALLLAILKRCGVRPWLAASAATMFALFGSGYQNFARAFQIGFVGALVFGFAQLLCALDSGPLRRRDWLGLAAGAAGLMCAGIALPMVVIVGVAAFLQRGVRVALFHAAPLVLGYAVWYVAIGHEGVGPVHATVGGVVRFGATGVSATFEHLGQARAVAGLLVVVLVVGSFLAWRGPLRPGTVPTPTAATIACLAGLVAFLVISGSGRDAMFGASYARTSRYLHINAALLIVPLGVAAEAIVRRRRILVIPVIAVFLVGIPGNISTFVDYEHSISATQQSFREQVLWTPRVDNVRELPPTFRPQSVGAPDLTLGWLLAATADGKVPPPNPNAADARRAAQQVVAKAVFANKIAKACHEEHVKCLQPPHP
jgi:hypothetical protein